MRLISRRASATSPPQRRSTRRQMRSAERGDHGIAASASHWRSGAGNASNSARGSRPEGPSSEERAAFAAARRLTGRASARPSGAKARASRWRMGGGPPRAAR
jgi:hypothetical protein